MSKCTRCAVFLCTYVFLQYSLLLFLFRFIYIQSPRLIHELLCIPTFVLLYFNKKNMTHCYVRDICFLYFCCNVSSFRLIMLYYLIVFYKRITFHELLFFVEHFQKVKTSLIAKTNFCYTYSFIFIFNFYSFLIIAYLYSTFYI